MPALAGRLLPYSIRCALRGVRIDNHAANLLLHWRALGVLTGQRPTRLTAAESIADASALRGATFSGGTA